jgi:tungstate transport system ATP-binding protein
MMPLGLEVKGIAKSYEGIPVLDDLSFEFNAGNTYVVMGSNGCGKSTFLRLCALLEEPDSGSIIFKSDNVILPVDLELRRRITLVLPKVGIFNATVVNNLAYGLKIRGIEKHEGAERVEKMLEFIGLSHKRNQNALTLSSGETQRLGIGRALVIEPDILFLDEPTASVDEKNSELIVDMILQMRQAAKTAIIMTTHDSQQAIRISSLILSIKERKLFSVSRKVYL